MIKGLKTLALIINREIKWMRHHWICWFLTVVGPILGFLLILGIFQNDAVRDIPITVVDLDHSEMSREVIRMISATSVAKIESECSSLYEAEELMLKGETNAIVYIEKGLEQGVLKSTSPKVITYISTVNIIKGGLLKSAILKASATLNAGIEMQIAMKKGSNVDQALANVVPIRLDSHVLFNPQTNYFYFLGSVLMPVILIIFTLLGSIYSLGTELRNKSSIEALELANNNIVLLVSGKLLPFTALFFMQALIINFLLFFVKGMPMQGSYLVLMLSELVLIISYQSLAVFIVGILGNLRLSLSIGSAYSMMALTFSGLTFPEMAMPFACRVFSQLFPMFYWLKTFIGQTLRGESLDIAITQIAYLAVFIVLGIICSYWLKQKYSNKKFWNKQ